MLLELLSEERLVELREPDEESNSSSVSLLLPHNKYLRGTVANAGKWIYGSDNPDIKPQQVFLYEDQELSLMNEGTKPTVLPAKVVNTLKRELQSLTEPPGTYETTVLMMRTFMRDHKVFRDSLDGIPDEDKFNAAMKEDETLKKVYWALRFALTRSEFETVRRLKAWLPVSQLFKNEKHLMKIWFTLQEKVSEDIVKELEELSFSRLEIRRMIETRISPVIMYNPVSGWLILARFGKTNTMFMTLMYINHDLYHEIRETKKMTWNDIIHAVWGEYDTRQAMLERKKYKGAD